MVNAAWSEAEYCTYFSGIASLHKVAGHNLSILIYLDSTGTMEDVH